MTKSSNKAIPTDDKDAFTSIITLYHCNQELLKSYRNDLKKTDPDKSRDKKSLSEYLKFRPKEPELEGFKTFSFEFWDDFIKKFSVVQDFVSSTSVQPALPYRNNETGGNLLFRPVGLLPFVIACTEIRARTSLSFADIFRRYSTINFTLNKSPWPQIMWNNRSKTMIMNNQMTTKLLLWYLYDPKIMKPGELISLKDKYAAAINYEGKVEEVLDGINNKL